MLILSAVSLTASGDEQMKKMIKYFLNLYMLLFMLCNMCHSDNIMVCSFFDNPIVKIYSLSNNADINYLYSIDTKGLPVNIEFAPDGRWGLIGHYTASASKSITTILKVDNKKQISILDNIENKYHELLAITPDSSIGVHGRNLQTIKMNKDYSYQTFSSQYTEDLGMNASFSRLNNYLYTDPPFGPLGSNMYVYEYEIIPDNIVKPTGFSIALERYSTGQDLNISPDGKTCIVLGVWITSMSILPEGGLVIKDAKKQIDLRGPNEIVFTPDSKYAIVSFLEGIESYLINNDSTMTFIQSLRLLGAPGEDLAITPDGKYAVTRWLSSTGTIYNIIKINPDGTIEYLPEKDFAENGAVSAMAFLPPYQEYLSTSWYLY